MHAPDGTGAFAHQVHADGIQTRTGTVGEGVTDVHHEVETLLDHLLGDRQKRIAGEHGVVEAGVAHVRSAQRPQPLESELPAHGFQPGDGALRVGHSGRRLYHVADADRRAVASGEIENLLETLRVRGFRVDEDVAEELLGVLHQEAPPVSLRSVQSHQCPR